jgi:hypothetical protein
LAFWPTKSGLYLWDEHMPEGYLGFWGGVPSKEVLPFLPNSEPSYFRAELIRASLGDRLPG